MFKSASGCDPNYESPIKQENDVTLAPLTSMEVGSFALAYREGDSTVLLEDLGGCMGAADNLTEEEVRRLHSFLSQWLEKNQKDHF